jgi:hypothetical protein
LVTAGQNGRSFYNRSISKDLPWKLPAGSDHIGLFCEKVPQEPPENFSSHKRLHTRYLKISLTSKQALARGSLITIATEKNKKTMMKTTAMNNREEGAVNK